jgi:Chaperone of endosialidase
MAVPYTFGNATTSIPLSQLDSNFATPITIGNTAVYLGNTTTSFGNVTLTNTTISSGNATLTKITAPTHDAGSGNALTLQSNSTTGLYIDTSQNVGIGTTSPSQKFQINGGNAIITNSGANCVLYLDSTNTYIRRNTSDGSFVINNENSTNTIFSTGGTERMRIDGSGNLLVGTTSYTTGKLVIQSKDTVYGGIQLVQYGGTNYWTQNVDSNAGYTWGKNGADFWYAGRSGSNNCVSSNGSWVNSSDSRLKENIEPLQNCLQDICKLQGVSFTRIDGGHEEIGLIAQDVEKVFPKAVEVPSNKTEFYALNYGSLVAPLIEAIKELKAEFDAYKTAHP